MRILLEVGIFETAPLRDWRLERVAIQKGKIGAATPKPQLYRSSAKLGHQENLRRLEEDFRSVLDDGITHKDHRISIGVTAMPVAQNIRANTLQR